ncbi:MAG: hypothetical protein LBN39_08080, partial [Planctomycetaceae bacterium]|jgi:hypothetical protein|nr:hypothetical protein [Planctomycetaceae bacterium]
VKVLAGVFGLETVPVINERQKLDLTQTPAETLIQTADGKSMLSGSKGMHQLREGLVYRERAAGENPSKYSFKIISNEYLLKHGI